MLSKKILIAVVALVLVSATGLMAKTDWHGKFWGDNEGEWKGTLYDSEVDPPIFKGAWTDGTDKGEIFAELNYEGHGIYRIVKGVIMTITDTK